MTTTGQWPNPSVAVGHLPYSLTVQLTVGTYSTLGVRM